MATLTFKMPGEQSKNVGEWDHITWFKNGKVEVHVSGNDKPVMVFNAKELNQTNTKRVPAEKGEKNTRKPRTKKHTPVTDEMSGSLPSAPSGWMGPFMGCIKTYPTGEDGKRYQNHFDTISEAIDAAKNFSNILGIVKDKKGYCLRVGPTFAKNKDTLEKKEVYWLKNDDEPVVEVEEQTPATEVVEEEKTPATEVEVEEKTPVVEVEVEEETPATEVEEDKPVPAQTKTQEILKQLDEGESSEEEEEVELEEWTDENGTTWLLDVESDELYKNDEDAAEPVAKRCWKNDKYEIIDL